MKLSQLLSVFPQLAWGDAAAQEVLDITQDSRQVKPGSVFVAIKGNSSDGHSFLSTAVAKGAIALIVENEALVPREFNGAVVTVASARQALDLLAQRFFSYPAKDLFCVGIT
jgi:UDP-N-acetylmuramoyl-L-alanyl-D-glutamate--2,6-diaminopimelate ligase